MEQILVPIDFTKASYKGVEKAIDLASQEQAEVHLLNFVTPVKKNGTNHVMQKDEVLDCTLNQLKEHEEKLRELLHNLDNKGVTVHSEIKVGPFKQGLKKYIDKHEVGLLVVGVNGAHTIGDLFCKNKEGKSDINVSCPLKVFKI